MTEDDIHEDDCAICDVIRRHNLPYALAMLLHLLPDLADIGVGISVELPEQYNMDFASALADLNSGTLSNIVN